MQREADQKRADRQFEMMMAAFGQRGFQQGGGGQQGYPNGYSHVVSGPASHSTLPGPSSPGDLWLDRGDDCGSGDIPFNSGTQNGL